MSIYIYIYMAVSILYLSFYNHKTITEQTLKFRVGEPQAKWTIELYLPRVHIYIGTLIWVLIFYENVCVCRGCGLRRSKVFVFYV